MRERLDKVLARLGCGSRREIRDWVRNRRVTVDGVAAKDPGQPVDPEDQTLAVDGVAVAYTRHLHLLLHKPAGVITTTASGRQPTVLDLVPERWRRPGLHPVGRLDKDTEGLLLLTTDGTLTHCLLAPRRHVEKEYYCRLDGPVGPAEVAAFLGGITLEGGEVCRPALLRPGPNPGEATVIITEGMYHQVKRMFAAHQRRVEYLKRLRLGPLRLDPALTPGALRELTPAEAGALYAAAGLRAPGP